MRKLNWKKVIAGTLSAVMLLSVTAVSYTHLDVYKRQVINVFMNMIAGRKASNGSMQMMVTEVFSPL